MTAEVRGWAYNGKAQATNPQVVTTVANARMVAVETVGAGSCSDCHERAEKRLLLVGSSLRAQRAICLSCASVTPCRPPF